MTDYETVLVAIDLGENSGDLIQRALAVADEPERVHVAFVHQRMDSVYVDVGPMASALAKVGPIEDRLQKDLRRLLSDWATASDVPAENTHFRIGKPADQIEALAADLGADLLVIGTHSRKGLQRLLGSTANALIHHVKCDVLSVRAR